MRLVASGESAPFDAALLQVFETVNGGVVVDVRIT